MNNLPWNTRCCNQVFRCIGWRWKDIRDKPSSNLGEIDPEKIRIYDIDLGEEHYWTSPEDYAYISKYVSNLIKSFIENNEKVNWEWLYSTSGYYY